MLTTTQRAQFDELGTQNVRVKLSSSPGGRDAILNRFLPSGDVIKGDVEDWLVAGGVAETAQQRAILRWARTAAWASIVGAALTAFGIAYSIWFPK